MIILRDYLIENNGKYEIRRMTANNFIYFNVYEKILPTLECMEYCLNESKHKNIYRENPDILLKYCLRYCDMGCVMYIYMQDELIKKKMHVCINLICQYGDCKIIKSFLDYYQYIDIGVIGTAYMRFILYTKKVYFPTIYVIILIFIALVIIGSFYR